MLPLHKFCKTVTIRRFRHRISCPSQCLFAASAVKFLQDTTIRRFRRRILVQVRAYSLPPLSYSCKTQLFAAFVVEFPSKSVPICHLRHRIPARYDYLPLPLSNSRPSKCLFAASAIEFLQTKPTLPRESLLHEVSIASPIAER